MPELPEVELVKRGLEHVVGEKIVDVSFSEAVINGKAQSKDTIIKKISLQHFKEAVLNTTIQSLSRRSKYLIFNLTNETDSLVLISHLGMSGAYFVVRSIEDISVPNYKKHWHVQFHLSNGQKLVYSDIRRFGEMMIHQEALDHLSIRSMAPEPFDRHAKEYFLAMLNNKKWQKKSIKEAILNHTIVSGCGNIYACEALHLTKIHPARLVLDVSQEERSKLFDRIVQVLREGIEYGGSSISTYRDTSGNSGSMQNRFLVYGLKTCGTCGNPVSQRVISNRNSHFCTHCQK